jgi:sulfur carrier protein ThiS
MKIRIRLIPENREEVINIEKKRVRVRDLLVKIGLSASMAVVVKEGEVLTEDDVLLEDDFVEVYRVVSGG